MRHEQAFYFQRRDEGGEFQQTILGLYEYHREIAANCVSIAQRRKTVPPFDVLIEQHEWTSFGAPMVAKAHLKMRLPRPK
jgi:hypothetical protein